MSVWWRNYHHQRSLNTTPVFQVVFALQNAPDVRQKLAGVVAEPFSGRDLRVRFDLVMHALEGDGKVGFSWLYNRDLFDRWRVEQMARQHMRVLEAMIADSDQAIGRVDVLGSEERRQILEAMERY